MKHRKIILFAIIIVLLVAFWWLHKSQQSAAIPKPALPTSVVTNPTQIISPTVSTITNVKSQEPPPYSASAAEWGVWERKMDKEDPNWQYKLPISFYGRVVDDENVSIAGADVEFVWTDLSNEGTSKKTTQSDMNGMFSLTGATGKGLSVYVSKSGYKRWISKNRTSFEYSPLANSDKHYIPDSMNPVVFVMRKNREAETLEARENMEAQLQPGENKLFTIGPNGASILVERLSNEDTNSRTWNAQVSMPNGGLQLATDEFPYEAPLDGYESSLVVSNGIPKPPNWPWGWGAMLYVKTAQGYGRVKVHYTPNMPYVYVDSWFNPNANSRNLELDPAKIIKIP
jgi:hypothetical protein